MENWCGDREAFDGHRILQCNPQSRSSSLANPQASIWHRTAVAKIEAMLLLNSDWNSQGAVRPNERAVELAKRMLRSLDWFNLAPDRIDPSLEEGICLAFRKADRYADIECFNEGEILAIVSSKEGSETWDVCETGLTDSIARILDFIRG
jgi:hypothetical protein